MEENTFPGEWFTMHTATLSHNAAASGIAHEVTVLFSRLGLDAVIRDPESAQVIAATPNAESRMLAAQPGAVKVVATRLAGSSLRVELLPDQSPDDLTARQQQVAECLAQGMRNAQIAETLGISLHTVRRHLEQIFRRLGVNNRRDAVRVMRTAAAIAR